MLKTENAVLARDVGKTIKWQKKETGKLDVNTGLTLKVNTAGEIDVDITKLPKVADKDARTGDVTIHNPDGTDVVLETPRVTIGVNNNWHIDGVDTGKPSRGVQGEQGIQGIQGRQGNSAYEVALANGYIGTESQWLASLKGEKGDKGAKGDRGEKGEKGDTGLTGKNAAEIVSGELQGSNVVFTKSDSTKFSVDVGHIVEKVKADRFLKEVTYNSRTKKLKFKTDNDAGTAPAEFEVLIADLMPVKVGNGLSGNGSETDKLTVVADPTSILQVTAEGIGVNLNSDNLIKLTDGTGKVTLGYIIKAD